MRNFNIYICMTLVALFYFSTTGWIWGESVSKKNREAIKLYSEDKIDEALSKWQDAQVKSPEKKELYYNIGNALHGQGKYEDAYREYEQALDSKYADFKARTYYNMGNTNYRMGKLLDAIEDYEKTLEINPDDEDAKYNIEFIKEKLKENMQKDQEEGEKSHVQEGKGQEAEESEGEKEQEKRSTGEEKESQEQQEEQKDVGQKDEEKDQEGSKASEAREEREDDMSKEDAMRLLDALRDDELELQKELRVHPGESGYRVDKDW